MVPKYKELEANLIESEFKEGATCYRKPLPMYRNKAQSKKQRGLGAALLDRLEWQNLSSANHLRRSDIVMYTASAFAKNKQYAKDADQTTNHWHITD